jgi:hypothetical protein
MKIISLFIVFFSLSFQSAKAIDRESIESLKKQGFQVRMGELTGAGGKLALSKLAGFIHPQGIVMKEDCRNIVVSKTSNQNDLKISDVTKVLVEQDYIQSSEFVGFFTY